MNRRDIYKFSLKTLSYQKVEENAIRKLYREHPILVVIVLIAGFFTISLFIQSPTERTLANKNKALSKQLATLSNQVYEFETSIEKLSIKDDSLYRAILGEQPLANDVRNAGLGGKLQKQTYSERIHDASDKLEQLQARLKVQDQSYEILLKKAIKNKERLLHIPAIIPIDSKDLSRIGSGFGMRNHPILNIRRMHEGIDMYARKGAPIYSTAHGRVKLCRYSTTFGKLVVIDHGNGIETLYAHLSEYKVQAGDKVKRGQVIGTIGSTGLSAGRHLHYEVHLNGEETNPVHYFFNDLSPQQYEEIKRLAARDLNSMD